MTPITQLLNNNPYLEWPRSLEGALVWVALLALGAYLAYRWRRLNAAWDGRRLGVLVVLLLLTPLATLFAGVRLPPGTALPPPNLPIEPLGPALMAFAVLPLILAAGLLGPAYAALVGAFSGLLLGIWETHTVFTVLEHAILGVLLGAAIRQRYRTFSYRLLRRPLVAGAVFALIYPLLFFLAALSMFDGTLTARLDFAITRVWMNSLAMAGQLLIAGALAEGIAALLPFAWGGRSPWLASPSESSLETRFRYRLGALIAALVVLLMVGDWYVAGGAARQMLERRMQDTAQIGAESIPFFLETGQNLILQIAADQDLYATPDSELNDLLAGHLRSTPYFRQLSLLDESGQKRAGYPIQDLESVFFTQLEDNGIELALQGVPFQFYTVPPLEGEAAAQVSFIASLVDGRGEVRGVIVGRSDLTSNPFTKPLLTNLENMTDIGGQGMLVDEEGRILYHPLPKLVMTAYTGQTASSSLFYDETGPDGTRQLVYYQPVVGRPWAVVLTVSAQQAQQLALNIAAPLLTILSGASLVVLFLMRMSLRAVSGSLQNLAFEADRIAQGNLDHALEDGGVDEVGQLRRSFEKMRLGLKGRMDELNRLLVVSQGVAASLEIEASLKPVLEAALSVGASAARVVVSPDVLPELGDHTARLGTGPAEEKYQFLDPHVMELSRRQNRVELTNPSRARVLNVPAGKPVPSALLALALYHESNFYGSLWLAFDQPHRFSEEELRFLTTLAGTAAMAVANASLFLSAEIGRQRLENILTSTPDPVLVTDHENRLLLANPAAQQIMIDPNAHPAGLPIGQVIAHPEILALLQATDPEREAAEIAFPDGRYFYATVSSVVADGKTVGRVCVLQEITRFKQLDTMKSEFVATVSHDLRSPLTLMRGYATMLQMVGDLNEQQTSYVRKIISSVENMARLVSNLLDLGRIEAGVALKLEMVPVADLLEQVVGGQQLQAAQKRIQLSSEITPHTSPLLEADQALLHQALQNLVENAIKYTEAGGRVKVQVYERSANLVFEISDTGIGVAPVDQPRLFERFYRGVRREARIQRGSGLGLAIVKSIAERHGGRVWVESQLGKGSRFYLALPLRHSHPGDQESG